jgi:hypothetical protein
VPDSETLDALADGREVRVTTPVRAHGFDPLDDDELYDELPESVGTVLVAGHPAYLDDDERRKAVAPRLAAARERYPDAWVGTEGVERIALTVGGTQYELLSRSTERDVRALREAGYSGNIAIYAPTVLTSDHDVILDALGDYVSRRSAVEQALPENPSTDSSASGRTRNVLLQASREYGLAGPKETIAGRVETLRDAGADTIVSYPARGLDPTE